MKTKAGITLFISIVFLSVLAFIGIVIESVRIDICKQKLGQAGSLAQDSVFSYYAQELWEDYGLFLLWKDREEVEKDLEYYLDKNLESESDSGYMSLSKLKKHSCGFQKFTYGIDNQGLFIGNQMISYMKYHITEDMIRQFLNISEQDKGKEQVQPCLEELYDNQTLFQDMEDVVSGMNQLVHVGANIEKTTYEHLCEIERILSSVGSGNITTEVKKNLKQEVEVFLSDWNKQELFLSDIVNAANSYEQDLQQVRTQFNQWKSNITNKSKFWEREERDIITSEMTLAENEISSQEQDIYKVCESKEKAENMKRWLEDIRKETEFLFHNYQIHAENITTELQGIARGKSLALNLCISDFQILYDVNEPGEQVDTSFLEEFEAFLSGSWIMDLVAHPSSKTVKESELYMQPHSKKYNVELWKNESKWKQYQNKAVIGLYLVDKFPNYLSNEDKQALNYQLEYILGGYASDKENLQYVLTKIYKVRSKYNFLYLMRDEKKKAEAYALASAIAGGTGMHFIVKGVEYWILYLWAQAEARIDLRDLLDGYCVKIIKGQQDWNLDLKSIGASIDGSSGKKSKQGCSYLDYLKILIGKEKTGCLVNRCISLIDINVKKEYCPKFQIRECIVGGTIALQYEVQPLFTEIAFIREKIMQSNQPFYVQKSLEFQY